MQPAELIGEPSPPGGEGGDAARVFVARRCHFTTAGGTETRLACRIVVGATLFVQLDDGGADDEPDIMRSGVVRDAAPLARLSKITSRKTVAGLVLFHFKRGTAANAATAKPGSDERERVIAFILAEEHSRECIEAVRARYKYLISRPPPPPPPRRKDASVAASPSPPEDAGENAPPVKPTRAPAPPLKPTRTPPPLPPRPADVQEQHAPDGTPGRRVWVRGGEGAETSP